MKTLCFILLSISCFAQVGINTTDPQAMLDINGNLIIREVAHATGNFQFLGRDIATGKVVWVDAPVVSSGHNIQKYFRSPGIVVEIEPGTPGPFEATNIDLDLSQGVSVAAGSKATVFVAFKI